MNNPGVGEEAGKVASGFIDAMKSQPLALALAVMNIALLILFWFILDRVDKDSRQRETMLHEEQREIRGLLSKCVVPMQP